MFYAKIYPTKSKNIPMQQSQVLSILKTGANVFLTGEPGSGKTHTINEYIAYLRERGIEHAITASTGIAATHIGGRTIHSWSGIGIASRLDSYAIDKIVSNEHTVKRVSPAKVLIIDEVSMLSSETLSMVDAVLRGIKRNPHPFGGLQIILVGDFFQLPPIMRKEIESDKQADMFTENKSIFAYNSSVWNKLNPLVCYLTEQYRQDDEEFLNILNAIRANSFEDKHLQSINKRKIEYAKAPADVPKLFSHNLDVDRVNDEMLGRLPGRPKTFFMSAHGSKLLIESLKKGCLSPEKLLLKKGAVVMFTKNSLQQGFVNGTLGVVEDFNFLNDNPIIRTRSGQKIEAEPLEWAIKDNDQTLATIKQMPLRLAWAITVHKSQGMSMDEAVIDLGRVFEYGQGYVALSRVRRLSGVHLLGYNSRSFQVHPEILEKDKDFRGASDAIAQTFSELPAEELEKMLNNFVIACGGKLSCDVNRYHPAEQREGKVYKNKEKEISLRQEGKRTQSKFDEIRKKYPNAYRPWEPEQDAILEKLFLEGVPVSDIAKTLGRKKGAITSRLVLAGLLEDGDNGHAIPVDKT